MNELARKYRQRAERLRRQAAALKRSELQRLLAHLASAYSLIANELERS